jgi:hypothetical protein
MATSYMSHATSSCSSNFVIFSFYNKWLTIGFDFQRVLGVFLFTTVSRMALGPTQPPIQWVSGAPSLAVKRPGREADHSPPSSAEVKNAYSYTSTLPIHLHGMVLS